MRIAVAATCGWLFLVPLATAADSAPAWSPDGRRVAYLSGRTLVVAHTETGRRETISRSVQSFAWSSDGRLLLYRSADGIWTSHADGTHRRHLGESSHAPVWADSTHVAFVVDGDAESTLVTVSSDNGERRALVVVPHSCIEDRILLPDPRTSRIAFSCVEQSFYPFGYTWQFAVVDTVTATATRPDVLGLPLSFSPGGSRLAVRALEPTSDPSVYAWAIEVLDLHSGTTRSLGSFSDAVFAADWRYAALLGDESSSIVEIASGRRTAHVGVAPSWSRRGALTFVRGGYVWRARANGSGAVRLGPGGQPAWSPDGGALVFVRAGRVWAMRADGTHGRRLG